MKLLVTFNKTLGDDLYAKSCDFLFKSYEVILNAIFDKSYNIRVLINFSLDGFVRYRLTSYN